MTVCSIDCVETQIRKKLIMSRIPAAASREALDLSAFHTQLPIQRIQTFEDISGLKDLEFAPHRYRERSSGNMF